MKLKYDRFEGLGCLYVRGEVAESLTKLLLVGIETIIQGLEETLVINLTLATIPVSALDPLVEFKKKASSMTQHKLYWITKERGLSDFKTIDLFISLLPGAKSRQVGERIKADDQAFIHLSRVQFLQNKIREIGGDDDNVTRLIHEHASLKEQKRILETMIRVQVARSKLQVLQPSTDQKIEQKTQEQLELIKTNFGRELDL